MIVPVVVVQDGTAYQARCRHPVELTAGGETRFEAVRALEEAIRARVGGEVEVMPLEADAHHPWIASAGSVPDDDLTDEWLAGVAEYRRQRDEDPAVGPPTPIIPQLPPILPAEARP